MQAKSKALKPAPAPVAAPEDIHALYATLGDAIARILAHPDCPAVVASKLGELMNELGNEAGVLNDDDIQSRVLLPAALKALTVAKAEADATS